MSQLSSQAERANPFFLHLIVLFRPSMGWMMPTYCMEIFTQSTDSNAIIFPTDTPRNNV